MATLDWSPSLFEGQSWTTWEENFQLTKGQDDTDGPEKTKTDSSIMKLRKDDMQLFGLCPSQDECYLVVCEKCGQVIKPQALKVHMELRHANAQQTSISGSSGSFVTSKKKSSPIEKQAMAFNRTMTSKPVINIPKTTLASVSNPTISVPKATVVSPPKSCSPKVPSAKSEMPPATKRNTPSPSGVDSQKQNAAKLLRKSQQPVLNLEKIRVPSPLATKSISAPLLKMAAERMDVNGRDLLSDSLQKLPKQIPCKDREFCPDIHCGVLVSDTGQQCTRSLTCKRHLLSLRRAVSGRSKAFDMLLSEHREKKDLQKQIKLQQAAITAANNLGHSQGFTLNKSLPTASPANTVKPVHRVIQSPFYRSTSKPNHEVSPKASVSSEHQPTNAWNKMDDPFIPDSYSPSPAAMCTFGARYKGGNLMYTRKMDLLCNAFRDCTERYLHPPPFKKMCVETKRKKETSLPSRDPYEFGYLDSNGNIGGSSMAQSKSSKNSKLAAVRAIKPKDLIKPNTPSATASKSNNIHKRKKPASGSLSGSLATANHTSPHTAVPLTIPVQSAMLTNKNCQPNKINLRDINLVVTGMDPNLGPLINLNAASLMNADLSQNSLNIVQLQPNLIFADNLSTATFAGNGTGGKVPTTLCAVQQSNSSTTSQLFRSGSVSPQVSSPLVNGSMSSGKNHTDSRTPSPGNELSNSGQFTILTGKPGKHIQHRAVGKQQYQINTGRLLTTSGYQQMQPVQMQQIQIQGGSIKSDSNAVGASIRQLPGLSIPLVQQGCPQQQMQGRTFYTSNDDSLKQQQESTPNAVS